MGVLVNREFTRARGLLDPPSGKLRLPARPHQPRPRRRLSSMTASSSSFAILSEL